MDTVIRVRAVINEPVCSSSPTVGVPEKDPPDVLNRRKCLEYLAALRHAKWFQVKRICTMENMFTPKYPESQIVTKTAQTDLGLRLTPKY